MRVAGPALLLLATLPLPAVAQPLHALRPHAPRSQAHHLHRTGGARQSAQTASGWGTTVYGSSLSFVNGTCVDPYDPDPIGGPDAVGEGGPGGYGPQCRAQAGVIPGTTVR